MIHTFVRTFYNNPLYSYNDPHFLKWSALFVQEFLPFVWPFSNDPLYTYNDSHVSHNDPHLPSNDPLYTYNDSHSSYTDPHFNNADNDPHFQIRKLVAFDMWFEVIILNLGLSSNLIGTIGRKIYCNLSVAIGTNNIDC